MVHIEVQTPDCWEWIRRSFVPRCR
ncbi:hypothetical protein NC651_032974 [Populus alba x Populus x berolinensis]|nr:hypothetical protein NC651_032974 [Populus alba x Populus x berolinensis]